MILSKEKETFSSLKKKFRYFQFDAADFFSSAAYEIAMKKESKTTKWLFPQNKKRMKNLRVLFSIIPYKKVFDNVLHL